MGMKMMMMIMERMMRMRKEGRDEVVHPKSERTQLTVTMTKTRTQRLARSLSVHAQPVHLQTHVRTSAPL